MGYNSFLRSPKKEEQQVPDDPVTEQGDIDIMDELEGILGIENNEGKLGGKKIQGHLSWDSMDWESGLEEREQEAYTTNNCFDEEEEEDEESDELYNKLKVLKKENLGFLELDDEKRVSLNLNLNYQDVLDAWSDRGPLRADDDSISMASNGYYMGEVPVMEEERTKREVSVLRYKEKRQTRLFSKKIRYEVRKLNADKRPRLKGRFVKRLHF